MDAILGDLGVDVASEADAVDEVLRKKVESQLKLDTNPLVMPTLPPVAYPHLSNSSTLDLLKDLQRELDNVNSEEQRIVALLKMRFFKVLMLGKTNDSSSSTYHA